MITIGEGLSLSFLRLGSRSEESYHLGHPDGGQHDGDGLNHIQRTPTCVY
jgi:hypothetical protein